MNTNDLMEGLARGGMAKAAKPFLEQFIEQTRKQIFVMFSQTGDPLELARLSGAAMIVEAMDGKLKGDLDEGEQAQQQLNKK